jgi:hypothetical protein
MGVYTKHRKLKRVRSDSAGEASDGTDEEIDSRYRKTVHSYIKSLKRSSYISSDIYQEMMNQDVISDIVDKKKKDGIENLYNTYHEDIVCDEYIHSQRETEVSTLNKVGKDITNLANTNNNYQQEIRDNVVTNSDLLRYITEFL